VHLQSSRLWALLFIAVIAIAQAPLAAQDRFCGANHFEDARIEAIDANYANLSIVDCIQKNAGEPAVCQCPPINVKVDNLALRSGMQRFHVGDRIRLELAEDGDARREQRSRQLKEINGFWSIDVSRTTRLLVMTFSALVLLGIGAVVTGWQPFKLVLGFDNRYSNSKVQVALWFWIVISTYIASILCRVWFAGWDYFGAVNIPQNLLLVSGLSALTYGGAKAITTSKVNAEENSARAGIAPLSVASLKAPQNPRCAKFFGDLIRNDVGDFDFGDFQMLVITVLAVTMYLLLIFHSLHTIQFARTLTLPDLDTTTMAMFGLGQGAYLTKKAAGNAGTS
jgi:hypothetical protein